MTRLPQIPPAAADRRWFDAGVGFRCLGPECGDCCSRRVPGPEVRRQLAIDGRRPGGRC